MRLRRHHFGIARGAADPPRTLVVTTCDAGGARYGCLVKVNVIVKPKEAVLDPQGNAVRDAMRHLGMPEVRSVRIGKYMEIDLEGKDADLEKRLRGLCRDLLSNPVIEDYELQRPAGGTQKSTVGNRKKTSNPPSSRLRRGKQASKRSKRR
jgi:phosphoribosylformylglycinamidine synthase subunit PurS